TEYPVEEHNWSVGAEKADSLGVDVLSVSLGYNGFDNGVFNHTYSDLTGNKTMIARAVNLAAKKGILVVTAAGNDGERAWHYISTPGDADS
ncbi:S8 family serine peptidase, partial [Vibrio cholerae]|nr:S8 family serine peptidase [Vibrio cholerae]